MRISLDDIKHMERRYRATLINTITGFKSANLIGTLDTDGLPNVAIFNSCVHIGANPPLIGFIMRPLTVPRQTYENIRALGQYTINHVHVDFYEQAHQSSAKYAKGVSEFEATGLTTEYSDSIKAPYVKESKIKLGMEYVEEYEIKANGTILIIGKILEILIPEQHLEEDGFVDLGKAGSTAVTGLESYFKAELMGRRPYARP